MFSDFMIQWTFRAVTLFIVAAIIEFFHITQPWAIFGIAIFWDVFDDALRDALKKGKTK